MEASTGGAPPSSAASTGDAQIDAALQAIEDHLNQAKGRVTSDLAALRDEVAKSQAAGQPVDHGVVISRLTAILEVVDAIDPQQAATGGTTTTGTAADGAAGGGAPAPPAEQPATEQAPPGADPSAPTATGSQGDAAHAGGEPAAGGAPAAPAEAAQPQPADALAVYTFSGDPSLIDARAWPRANVITEDGRPLYHYTGDSAPGEQHGNGLDNGQWQIYTGNVRPVASA